MSSQFELMNAQPGDYALAIALVSQGKIDLKPLVTHRLVKPPTDGWHLC